MKKIFNLLLVMIMTVLSFGTLTGCKDEEPAPVQTPITCEIKFVREVDEKYKPIGEAEYAFEVNTKFYAIVHFTMINYHPEEYAMIDFRVYLPHAEYYSTHEFKKGPQIPSESYVPRLEQDGTTYEVICLSGMQFSVKPGQEAFDYTYCFELKADSVCESAKFEVVFSSTLESDRSNEVMNKNYPFSATYSFVSAVGGEE